MTPRTLITRSAIAIALLLGTVTAVTVTDATGQPRLEQIQSTPTIRPTNRPRAIGRMNQTPTPLVTATNRPRTTPIAATATVSGIPTVRPTPRPR